MRRLTKRDVEALLRDYDDDPVAALTVALRRLVDESGDPSELEFDQLIDTSPLRELIDTARRQALERRDRRALDALAVELNEERRVSPEISP